MESLSSIPPNGGVISLVGAGGKTTLMFSLARSMAACGMKVVSTTTTRIFMPDATETSVAALKRSGAADWIIVEADGAARRPLKAPAAGIFMPVRQIGDKIRHGEIIGRIEGVEVRARIDGVLRGLMRPGTYVMEGLKIGEIDPRGDEVCCDTISDKGRAVAGAVLEAILRFNFHPAP